MQQDFGTVKQRDTDLGDRIIPEVPLEVRIPNSRMQLEWEYFHVAISAYQVSSGASRGWALSISGWHVNQTTI